MAFDGTVIAGIVSEMQMLKGSRISKINQPESDELFITFGTPEFGTKKLLISANAGLPLIYFTEETKTNPATAPAFCMLLRKHIGGGHIVSITQPGMERIIRMEISHLNEMGDTCRKFLIFELMGKYSNIIFTDDNDKIIDSIRRVPAHVSSLRTVLPGCDYFLPQELKKADSFNVSSELFGSLASDAGEMPAAAFLLKNFSGISRITAEEICHLAGADPDTPISDFSALFYAFDRFINTIKSNGFSPRIIYRRGEPVEFSSLPLTVYDDYGIKRFDSVSEALESFYSEKEIITRIRQKSYDLRRITDQALERESKKLDLQEKQYKDTEKRDRLARYGELLRAYAYMLPAGEKSVTVQDYNDEYKEVTISLDPDLSIQDNATKYYDRYQKLRRTAIALETQIKTTRDQVDHLLSVKTSLGTAVTEADLAEIKDELVQAGYIKKPQLGSGKKGAKASAGNKNSSGKIAAEALHFISSDGFDIYVGKNNYQNEALTFSLAKPGDIWFHIKGRPGSHVILKTDGKTPSDKTFEEAGALAVFYSSAGKGEKADVDYTEKINIKKPAAARPGFVIYNSNYSLVATGDISGIKQVK